MGVGGWKRAVERVNSSMIYLIHCKNSWKCHNVPQHNNNINKNKMLLRMKGISQRVVQRRKLSFPIGWCIHQLYITVTEEGRFVLGHHFNSRSPHQYAPVFLGVTGKISRIGTTCREKQLSSWWSGNKKRGKGQGHSVSFMGCLSDLASFDWAPLIKVLPLHTWPQAGDIWSLEDTPGTNCGRWWGGSSPF
jgi:hypothetical protein